MSVISQKENGNTHIAFSGLTDTLVNTFHLVNTKEKSICPLYLVRNAPQSGNLTSISRQQQPDEE